MASHSGPPGRGMASLVAPSNGTDLITGISSSCRFAYCLVIVLKLERQLVEISHNHDTCIRVLAFELIDV